MPLPDRFVSRTEFSISFISASQKQNLESLKEALKALVSLDNFKTGNTMVTNLEMGLNQKQLAELLGTPTSRVSEYLKGKRDITLHVAKRLHKKLNIDADIILQ